MRSTIVPLGSFVIALLIASLQPSTRSLLRAAGDSTGCTVNTTVNATIDSRTRTVGTDSIRDDKKKQIKDELGAGFQDMKVDPTDPDVKKEIDDAAKGVEKDKEDGVTCVDVNATWKSLQVDATHVTVTVTCPFSVVILLPANASDVLKAHEAGHLQIAQMTKDFAAAKFKAAIDAAACDDASIGAAFDAAFATVISVLNAANQDYDNKTQHGTQGTAAQQLTQAAASFNTASAGK